MQRPIEKPQGLPENIQTAIVRQRYEALPPSDERADILNQQLIRVEHGPEDLLDRGLATQQSFDLVVTLANQQEGYIADVVGELADDNLVAVLARGTARTIRKGEQPQSAAEGLQSSLSLIDRAALQSPNKPAPKTQAAAEQQTIVMEMLIEELRQRLLSEMESDQPSSIKLALSRVAPDIRSAILDDPEIQDLIREQTGLGGRLRRMAASDAVIGEDGELEEVADSILQDTQEEAGNKGLTIYIHDDENGL